jgi:hypothetical protein
MHTAVPVFTVSKLTMYTNQSKVPSNSNVSKHLNILELPGTLDWTVLEWIPSIFHHSYSKKRPRMFPRILTYWNYMDDWTGLHTLAISIL